MDILRDPFANKDSAFTDDERVKLGLRGLLPTGPPRTQAEQVALVMEGLGRIGSSLGKYEYLVALLDRNARLFFAALKAHTSTIVPLVYTPVVGEACQAWSRLLAPARGLYICLRDAGHVADVLRSWPGAGSVRAICVTDGGRILGLGDLGANGMGIPVGKLALYSGLAGVDPASTLPVTLDVGTDNPELLADPCYVGLRVRREGGAAYYALVDEFVSAVVEVCGPGTLVQWEDFNNASAFTILDKYKGVLPSFNDDIEGTASVVVAGLMSAAMHMPGVPSLAQGTYLFYGAGEAGVGIADLLAYAIALHSRPPNAEGAVSPAEVDAARGRIWLVDTKGLVTAERAKEEGARFAAHKLHYAHPLVRLGDRHTHGQPAAAPTGGGSHLPDTTVAMPRDLEGIIRLVRPTALIGVSAQPQTFTLPVVRAMVDTVDGLAAEGLLGCLNDPAAAPQPVVFALSNPTSKAECTAEQAYGWTEGRAVYASGSPFDPVTITTHTGAARTLKPGQGNNAYVFPALGLATLSVRMRCLPMHTMYVAASALASYVDGGNVRSTGCLYPPLSDILSVSHAIATAVATDAYASGLAMLQPQPGDLAEHIRGNMWSPDY